MSEVKMPEPYAWASFNVLTKTQFLKLVPVTSMQAGVYQHTKLFSQTQMEVYAEAKVRDALEQAAQAIEDRERTGREWLPGSIWDTICRESASRVRALAPGADTEGA